MFDSDVIDDSNRLDPNLEPPLPAVTVASRVESTLIVAASSEPVTLVVTERELTKSQGIANELQPPPPLEHEPTIELSELNDRANDAQRKPNIPKITPPIAAMVQESGAEHSKPVATDVIHWTELSYDLGLQGFAHAIATNSVVGHYEHNHLQLFLTSDFMKFVNPENQAEICQALVSKLELPLNLDFQVQDELDAETPSETRLRQQHEHRQVAIDSIKQEKTVKKLQRAFGAELIESSVQLMDEIKG